MSIKCVVCRKHETREKMIVYSQTTDVDDSGLKQLLKVLPRIVGVLSTIYVVEMTSEEALKIKQNLSDIDTLIDDERLVEYSLEEELKDESTEKKLSGGNKSEERKETSE